MKVVLLLLVIGVPVVVDAKPEGGVEPATFCRFVPERADDFAWENDKIAFRTYGPALKMGGEDSGIDCWAKRVPYPIVDKWYRLNAEEKLSYHQDRGEGADFYHVGKSRGCGGTAIWHRNKMLLSNVFTSYKVVSSTTQSSVFVLNYQYRFDGRTIDEVKTITITLGKYVYKSESVFTENGKPASLEVAVGLTTHDQRGTATLDATSGWMAVWEDYKGKTGKFATGVAVNPADVIRMQNIASKRRDESHAVAILKTDAHGRTVHNAGFSWAKHSDLANADQWAAYLRGQAKDLQ